MILRIGRGHVFFLCSIRAASSALRDAKRGRPHAGQAKIVKFIVKITFGMEAGKQTDANKA